MVVIDHFLGPVGGTEQNIMFLCNQLPKTELDICFKVLSTIPEECLSIFNAPVHPPIKNKSVAGLRFLNRVKQLRSLIVKEKVDIVHAMCPISELAAVLATRSSSRASIMGSRRNIGYWQTLLTKWRGRLVTRFVDHFIANCEAAKDMAVKLEWVDPKKVTVIPNPINLQRVDLGLRTTLSKAMLGLESASLVVAMVANVRPIKEYETLFRAAQIVLAKDTSVRFLVIGKGDDAYQESLKKMVLELGIRDAVRWIDDVSNPFQILPLVDVGVLCSRSEGYSNALVEYAVARIPAIATRVGGSPEIVLDEVTGLLVEPGNPTQLAEKLLLLHADIDRRKLLGQQAYQNVFRNNFPQRVISAYEQAYRGILKTN